MNHSKPCTFDFTTLVNDDSFNLTEALSQTKVTDSVDAAPDFTPIVRLQPGTM